MLRHKAFWFMDAITGAKKRKHYDEIKFIIDNPTSLEAIESKKAHLYKILKHAVETVGYYKENESYKTLEDFPIVNKNIIRSSFEDFQSKKYLELPKSIVSTSGSTGTPFKVYQDNRKKIRNIADNIVFSEKVGFKIGYRLTYFRLWNAFEKKGILTRWIQNIVPIDVFDLKKKTVMDTIISNLTKSTSSNSWLGYASAYQEICKYLDQKKALPIANNLKSIIAISEKLNDYTKQAIYTYFGIKVISRYSNVENGIIAQQFLGEQEYFEINEASYVVEVLEFDSDKKVKDGESGRIVITDLFNYAMPMIRYDTGDVGVIGNKDSKVILTNITGRKIDLIYDTTGEIISVNLVLIVNKYPELKQAQLIQKSSKGYHFKLNAEKEFIRQEEFLNEFKKYLGKDAKITVEYVDEIPLLASGKRRVMVNEMKNV